MVPLNEVVEIGEDGRIAFEPVALELAAPVEDVLERVSDALDDAQTRNLLTSESWEVRTLSRLLEKYSDKPQRIEMDLEYMHLHLLRKIKDPDGLPDDAEILALAAACQEGAASMRAHDEKIEINRRRLATLMEREASEAQKQAIADLRAIKAILTEESGQQFDEDIDAFLDGTVAATADREKPATPPSMRLASRTAKIDIRLRKADDLARRVKDSPGYDSLDVGLKVAGGVGVFIALLTLVS